MQRLLSVMATPYAAALRRIAVIHALRSACAQGPPSRYCRRSALVGSVRSTEYPLTEGADCHSRLVADRRPLSVNGRFAAARPLSNPHRTVGLGCDPYVEVAASSRMSSNRSQALNFRAPIGARSGRRQVECCWLQVELTHTTLSRRAPLAACFQSERSARQLQARPQEMRQPIRRYTGLVVLRHLRFALAHEDGLVVRAVANSPLAALDGRRNVPAARRLAHLQTRQMQLGELAGGIVRLPWHRLTYSRLPSAQRKAAPSTPRPGRPTRSPPSPSVRQSAPPNFVAAAWPVQAQRGLRPDALPRAVGHGSGQDDALAALQAKGQLAQVPALPKHRPRRQDWHLSGRMLRWSVEQLPVEAPSAASEVHRQGHHQGHCPPTSP